MTAATATSPIEIIKHLEDQVNREIEEFLSAFAQAIRNKIGRDEEGSFKSAPEVDDREGSKLGVGAPGSSYSLYGTGGTSGISGGTSGGVTSGPYRPGWKGLRGLLRWLWRGRTPDNPDYAHLYPDLYPSGYHHSVIPPKTSENEPHSENVKGHMTLVEYGELSTLVDAFTEEVLITVYDGSLNEEIDELQQIFNKFHLSIKNLFRNARIALGDATPDAPLGVSTHSGEKVEVEPDEEKGGHALDPTSDEEIRRGYERQSFVKPKDRKQEILDAQINEPLKSPERDWWIGGSQKGNESRLPRLSVQKLHQVDVLKWLIHKGVDIQDYDAVQKVLEKEIGARVRGDILDNYLNLMGLNRNNEEHREIAEEKLRRIGFKGHLMSNTPQPMGFRPLQGSSKGVEEPDLSKAWAGELETEPDDEKTEKGEDEDYNKILADIGFNPEKEEEREEEKEEKEEKREDSRVSGLNKKIRDIKDDRSRRKIMRQWENLQKEFDERGDSETYSDEFVILLDKLANELTKQGNPTDIRDLVSQVSVESNKSIGELLRDEFYINKLKSRRIPLEERKNFFRKAMVS
jgi:hypothetical protein